MDLFLSLAFLLFKAELASTDHPYRLFQSLELHKATLNVTKFKAIFFGCIVIQMVEK